MTKMKAVGLYEYLPIENENSLQDVEIDKPEPGERDILVAVKAVSVNPVDTKIRAPKEGQESSPKVLGWDASGTVVKTGSQVTLFSEGDEVYYAGSVERQGANSDFHTVDERIAAKKPKTLNFSEAAAMPLTSITAWEALHDRMHIAKDPEKNAGKSILIIGAAGGVGSIATQLAKQAGLTVIGSASRPETKEWVTEKGADHIVNHHENIPEQLQQAGFPQVDYILCLHGTETHWGAMVEAIAPQGFICAIVETAGKVDLGALKNKSVTFAWEFMFTRAIFQTADMIEQHRLLTDLAGLLDEGKVTPTMTKQMHGFEAKNFREAHQLLEEGKMIGKLVIEK